MKVTLKEKLARFRDTHSYRVEKAKLEFVAGLNRLMQRGNVTNAELARRINSSPAYATKVMRGDCNFTVDSMVKIAHALGGSVHIHVADVEHEVRWHEVICNNAKSKRKASMAESIALRAFHWQEQGEDIRMPHQGKKLKENHNEKRISYA